jgi:hypothetical protein
MDVFAACWHMQGQPWRVAALLLSESMAGTCIRFTSLLQTAITGYVLLCLQA